MRVSALKLTRTRVDNHPELNSPAVSVAVAAVATILSLVIANTLLMAHAQQFVQWRQLRTEFAFASICGDHVFALVCIFVGYVAIQTRRWMFAFLIGTILALMSVPSGFHSGPYELMKAVRPLMSFHGDMLAVSYAINLILVASWVQVAKRSLR